MTKPLNIIELNGFLSKAECVGFIAKSEALGYEESKINTDVGPKTVENVRNNYRVFLGDERLANHLWLQLKTHIPDTIGVSKAIGLNPLFRFYRYEQGQKFRKHRDESFVKNETDFSYYTFLIYLNEDFTGGDTAFQATTIKAQTGKALIFTHQLEHEGTEVTDGVKYVLRSDVMYRLCGA